MAVLGPSRRATGSDRFIDAPAQLDGIGFRERLSPEELGDTSFPYPKARSLRQIALEIKKNRTEPFSGRT